MEGQEMQDLFELQRLYGIETSSRAKVYRATAGEFEQNKTATTRQITKAYDPSHYTIQRITGGVVTDGHFRTERKLFQTEIFDHTNRIVSRQVARTDESRFNTIRCLGHQDNTHNKVDRLRTWKDEFRPGILRTVGHEDDYDGHVIINVGNIDPGFSTVYRQVCIEEGRAATVSNVMFFAEHSVWTAERQLYRINEKSIHTAERQIIKSVKIYPATDIHIANLAKDRVVPVRNLYGTATEYFKVSRNIVMANERSAYFIIRREILVEQDRTKTVRHISTGRATCHFRVAITPLDREESVNPISRQVMRSEDSHWLAIRKMNKTPEEYFGKACLFRSNVSNLVISKDMVDANIALDRVYSDKEALLEIAMQRNDTHDAVNLHGNIVEFHDGKLVYYPPLNSQSTVLIAPNWNTSEEMMKECRDKNMIIEAYKVEGKHYKLHVRFDEQPKCPLFFSILAINPDRTVEDKGSPTVINLITAESLNEKQIKQIGALINPAVNNE